jgi:hypothetical protein
LNALRPGELERSDRRTFLQHHHQHLPLDFKAYVLEETGGEQGLDRSGSLFVGHRVADLDRQIGEHGASLGALDPLDADVLDGKGSNADADVARSAETRPASSFLFI